MWQETGGAGDAFDHMYIAEAHFIDGTALTPTSFGESGDYGEWKPIEVSGLTYGTNGFYLDFADSAALGNDVSGNDNDWTVTNLTAADQMLDSPTNNFCTLNPVDNSADPTEAISEGNLKDVCGTNYDTVRSTFYLTSGKWYWECLAVAVGSPQYGVATSSYQSGVGRRACYNYDGNKYQAGASDGSYGATFTNGDIIGSIRFNSRYDYLLQK